MNHLNQTNVPDDRFIERLDEQLSSEFRRLNRFSSPSGKIAVSRRSAAIAVLVGVVLAGASVFGTAAYLKDSWRRKIEIARIETDVSVKKAYLKAAREIAAEMEKRFSMGLIEEENILSMRAAAEKADLALQTSLVNRDEVNASGEVPRNELYAPMRRGRDFVSERLEIERKEAAASLKPIESRWERFQRLVEVGVVKKDQLDQVRAEMDAEKGKVEEIQKRLDLRKRFVTGAITAEEVEISGRIAEAERSLRAAEAKANSLQEKLNEFQNQESRGVMGGMEAALFHSASKAALEAARIELKLAAAEIEILKSAK